MGVLYPTDSGEDQANLVKTCLTSIPGIGPLDVDVRESGYLQFDVAFTGSLGSQSVSDLVPVDVSVRNGTTPIPNAVGVTQTVAADPNSIASFRSAVNSASSLAAGGLSQRTYSSFPGGVLDKAGGMLRSVGYAANSIPSAPDGFFRLSVATGTVFDAQLLFAVRLHALAEGRCTLVVQPPASNDGVHPDEIILFVASGVGFVDMVPDQLGQVDFGSSVAVDLVKMATAVDDGLTSTPAVPAISEDPVSPLVINVLANDRVTSGTLQLDRIVSQPTSSGTATVINAGAGTISYVPQRDFSGTDTFVYRMTDGLNHFDQATVTVTVTPVNDPPACAVPGPQTLNEDQTLTLTGATAITVTDVDVGTGVEQVTLVASHGLLTLGDPAQVGFGFSGGVGDGVADATMTFRGTLDQLNQALRGTLFTPTADFHGAATIAVNVNDLGNSGSGGAAIVNATIPITVCSVNDPPVNTAPGGQSTSENTPLVFTASHANEIATFDLEAAAETKPVQVTLTVAYGTLFLASTTGLSFSSGANGQASLTFTGLLPAINQALSGLAYVPNASPRFVGLDLLWFTTSDLGTSGGSATDPNALTVLADADFTLISVLADTTAPRVVGLTPGPDTTVSSFTNVVARFDEPLVAGTVNASTFRLSKQPGPDTLWGTADDSYVAGSVSYSAATQSATFTPTAPLADGNYGVWLDGAAGLTDMAGNRLDGEYPGSEPGFPSGNGTAGGNFVATFLFVAPTVTINQVVGQADPSVSLPLTFSVVFNAPVNDFRASNVAVSGTAPGTPVVEVTGSGTMYSVAVRGVSGNGTVLVSLPSGAAHFGDGTPNSSSTSTDNVVTYLPYPWHNELHPYDTFNPSPQGSVAPVDVLVIINYINAHGAGRLPIPVDLSIRPQDLIDVNGDQEVTPLDVLAVISFINSQGIVAGEGEGPATQAPATYVPRLEAAGQVPAEPLGQSARPLPTTAAGAKAEFAPSLWTARDVVGLAAPCTPPSRHVAVIDACLTQLAQDVTSASVRQDADAWFHAAGLSPRGSTPETAERSDNNWNDLNRPLNPV